MSHNKLGSAGVLVILLSYSSLNLSYAQFSNSGVVPGSSSSRQPIFSQSGTISPPGSNGNMSGGCRQSTVTPEAAARAAQEEQEKLEKQRLRFYQIEQQKAIYADKENRAKEEANAEIEIPAAVPIAPAESKPEIPNAPSLRHRLVLELVDDKGCVISPSGKPGEQITNGQSTGQKRNTPLESVSTYPKMKELLSEPWTEWSKQLSANLFATLKPKLSSSGKTEVAITISDSGALSAEIVSSSGNLSFDQSILNSIITLSYSPGLKFPQNSKWSQLRFLVTCEVSPTIAEGFDWPKPTI